MSFYAITEFDTEPKTAWEFHDLFILYEEKYDKFFCPFCEIKLSARLIYERNDLSRSPHFAAMQGEHIGNCDGGPIYIRNFKYKKPKAHYALQDMKFPQALLARPPRRQLTSHVFKPSQKSPSEATIEDKRKRGASLGAPIPKTYLLQSLVSVYNSVVREVCRKAREEKWADSSRKKEIKNALVIMPLRLEDETNYSDGFRTAGYNNTKYARIYHADGKVTLCQGQVIITSDLEIDSRVFKFTVLIKKPAIHSSLPKSHLKLISDLEAHSLNQEMLHWYAYGMPLSKSNDFELTLDNLDFFFFKPSYKAL